MDKGTRDSEKERKKREAGGWIELEGDKNATDTGKSFVQVPGTTARIQDTH